MANFQVFYNEIRDVRTFLAELFYGTRLHYSYPRFERYFGDHRSVTTWLLISDIIAWKHGIFMHMGGSSFKESIEPKLAKCMPYHLAVKYVKLEVSHEYCK